MLCARAQSSDSFKKEKRNRIPGTSCESNIVQTTIFNSINGQYLPTYRRNGEVV